MMASTSIRRAEQRDVERIATFNIRMADETEGKKLDAETVRQGVSRVINDSSKGFYILADDEHGQSVIGQLLVTFEWSDWRNKNFWWIQSVYVDPKFRRKRVFSQLFKFLKELASSNGEDICGFRLYVEDNNETAKKTYETLGFKKTTYEVYETNV